MSRTTNPASRMLLTLMAFLLAIGLACTQQEAVKFGAVVPLTGSSAIYGKQIANGIELAFEELKALPDAPEMELEVLDSESDPEKAKTALEQLYASDARAAIGGVTTAEALAMVQVADNMNRVLLSPSASAQELTGISREFYRVWPSDSREGSRMGQYAAQNLNIKTVVVLAADSTYAEGILTVFKTSFTQNGGEIVEELIYPENTSDLNALVERVVALKPDSVYIADYANTVIKLIQLLREMSFQGKILTVSAFATPQAIAAAGSAAEGVFVTHPQYTPDDQEDPKVKAFVEAYRSKFGETPGLYAAHGYDSMLVLYEAMKKGGDKGSSFWKGMRGVKDLPGVTGPLQFDEKGDVAKYPRVYFLLEGQAVDHANWVEKKRDEIRLQRQKLEEELRRLQQKSGG
ncbi:MAG: ABC transporter substrate-binding protein [Acidobacteria bacterium]|nr:ABC transporter substrate-binding protein [Acidobacteriota bacterium]